MRLGQQTEGRMGFLLLSLFMSFEVVWRGCNAGQIVVIPLTMTLGVLLL